jgi:16S rRNA G966 N2-methylase RsmD
MKSVVNPKSIHGMYPYRGKISALEAANIVSGFGPQTRLLDPFCGSGTIVYEAKKLGLKSAWGADLNPLAEWLTRAKLECPQSIDEVLAEVQSLIANSTPARTAKNKKLLFYFHEQTLKEIESLAPHFPDMSAYLKGCFAGAIALAARGCNGYQWTSSTVGKNLEDKVYVSFFDKFLAKTKKHHYPTPNVSESGFVKVDARDITSAFEEGSFDVVFSSPPYFDALDYTSYYAKILYLVLAEETSDLRQQLIQRTATYKEDMEKVLNEIVHVTSDIGKIIFVVGDKKTKDGVINGGEFFSELLHHKPTSIVERSYTGSSSQIFDEINKTKRKEQVVIWDKAKW